GRYDTIRRIEWATGCALFASAAAVRRVGRMDERYFLYLEDVDWSLRAQRAGVPIYFVPDVRIYHAVSRSVDRVESPIAWYYGWRNYYLLVESHGGPLQRLVARADLITRLVKTGFRLTLDAAARQDERYRIRAQALLDYSRRRFGELGSASAG